MARTRFGLGASPIPLRCAAVAVVVSCSISPIAFAQEATEAADYYDQATAAFERKDFRAAALAFEEAYRLAPHGAALYSAGLAWLFADERARAADDLSRALRSDQLSTDQVKDATGRLQELEAGLCALVVDGPAGSRVSVVHVDRREVPARVYVEPGKSYDVRLEFPDGGSRVQSVRAKIGTVDVRFEPEPVQRAPSVVGASQPSGPVTGKGEAETARPVDSIIPTLGWVAVGAAAVAGAGAAYSWSNALDARDDFVSSEYRNADARDRAERWVKWTNVSLAGAGILGATGVVLLLTQPGASEQEPAADAPERGLQVELGPRHLAVRGSF